LIEPSPGAILGTGAAADPAATRRAGKLLSQRPDPDHNVQPKEKHLMATEDRTEASSGPIEPSLFVLELRDDAVGPDHPKGTGIVWSKTREPRPGRLLLLRDSYEQHHVRVYSAGRAPGEWSGVALTRGYPTLGPEDAEIIAVSRGVLEADDEVAHG
jgi:hypothetical protein